MNEDAKKGENSFRNIIKGTSIFGGVQIFNILISAIRLKFVAIILGPTGMGVAGLFNSVSLTIQQFASLGLNLAVVKEIGYAKEDKRQLSDVITAIRPLILMSASIGALLCLLFPGLLSDMTFGDVSYTGAFLILAAAVFFSISGSALMSVLQGLHAVKPLSKASVIGSSVGLIVGVPLYWLLGTNGIVPAMSILALSTCLWYFLSLRKELKVSPNEWSRELHLPILKRVLFMGLVLMSNDLFRNLVNFLINIFIRKNGGMEDVGFFQSCSTMTSQYSAIVFTAMAMDYLPRLSGVSGDNLRMCEVVNRQMEIVGLLITPTACAVIFFAPWVMQILQTDAFLKAVTLLRLMAFGVIIRALMYPLGYIIFAKDNRRLFFWMESIGANLLTLILTCGAFTLFGLNGLGYAAITDCTICLCVYIIVNHRLYGYRLSRPVVGIICFAITIGCLMTSICIFMTGIPMIVTAALLLTLTGAFAGMKLMKRIRQ